VKGPVLYCPAGQDAAAASVEAAASVGENVMKRTARMPRTNDSRERRIRSPGVKRQTMEKKTWRAYTTSVKKFLPFLVRAPGAAICSLGLLIEVEPVEHV